MKRNADPHTATTHSTANRKVSDPPLVYATLLFMICRRIADRDRHLALQAQPNETLGELVHREQQWQRSEKHTARSAAHGGAGEAGRAHA